VCDRHIIVYLIGKQLCVYRDIACVKLSVADLWKNYVNKMKYKLGTSSWRRPNISE